LDEAFDIIWKYISHSLQEMLLLFVWQITGEGYGGSKPTWPQSGYLVEIKFVHILDTIFNFSCTDDI